jgi:hypothetical protein
MTRRLVPPVFLVLIAGCGDPDVRVYSAPKPHKVELDTTADYTILGAVFPADDPKYFFKLAGKSEDVAKYAPVFDQLIESVQFSNGLDKPPTWARPEGTRDGGPRQMRLGTILVGPAESKLEIAIAEAAGGLEGNMARWAGQVGAFAATVEKKPVQTKSGAAGLRVTVSGPKNPTQSGPMMGK